MKRQELGSKYPGRETPDLLLPLLMFAGLILILASFLVPEDGLYRYLHELLKELGIVVFSVFTVSYLYERLVARKYLAQFLSLLRAEVQTGESNAATCALLGIQQIFPTRDVFEVELPLAEIISHLAPGSRLHITGRSLFLTMTKAELIRQAVQQGATVQLCIADPRLASEELARLPDVELGDITSTLSVFNKHIAPWLRSAAPKGILYLAIHRAPLFDSCLQVYSPTLQLIVWDLSFGRDLTSKRIILVDPRKPLGNDLTNRYQSVWAGSEVILAYSGGEVTTDNLPDLLRRGGA